MCDTCSRSEEGKQEERRPERQEGGELSFIRLARHLPRSLWYKVNGLYIHRKWNGEQRKGPHARLTTVNNEQWKASRELVSSKCSQAKSILLSKSRTQVFRGCRLDSLERGLSVPHVCRSLRKEELRVKTFPLDLWGASITGSWYHTVPDIVTNYRGLQDFRCSGNLTSLHLNFWSSHLPVNNLPAETSRSRTTHWCNCCVFTDFNISIS